jgi:hypothetical protein
MNRNTVARLADGVSWVISIAWAALLIYAIIRPEIFGTSWLAPILITLMVVSFVLSRVSWRLRRA